MTKNNLRITAKHHAHFQTLTKTSVKFQEDLTKTVGGVAFTGLDAICDRQMVAQGITICLLTLMGGEINITTKISLNISKPKCEKLSKLRGAFGKFLAWSFISVTDLQTLSCLVSF